MQMQVMSLEIYSALMFIINNQQKVCHQKSSPPDSISPTKNHQFSFFNEKHHKLARFEAGKAIIILGVPIHGMWEGGV